MKSVSAKRTLSEIILAFPIFCLIGGPMTHAQVSYERIRNAEKEPQNWLTYSGNYNGQRFSALDQINTSNVKNLVPKWVFQSAALGKWETTPLVVDGILYGTAQDDRAFALDARTGRPIWEYQYTFPSDIRPCCGRVNRGFAILGDKLFFATLDAHVVALDAKTGAVIWNVAAIDYRKGYSFTMAPLAVKNLIIVAFPAASMARVDFLMLMKQRRASASGGSTPPLGRASRDTRRGKAIPGRLAERPRGSRECLIRRRINFSGRREIPRRPTVVRNGWGTISTAIVCWLWMWRLAS